MLLVKANAMGAGKTSGPDGSIMKSECFNRGSMGRALCVRGNARCAHVSPLCARAYALRTSTPKESSPNSRTHHSQNGGVLCYPGPTFPTPMQSRIRRGFFPQSQREVFQ